MKNRNGMICAKLPIETMDLEAVSKIAMMIAREKLTLKICCLTEDRTFDFADDESNHWEKVSNFLDIFKNGNLSKSKLLKIVRTNEEYELSWIERNSTEVAMYYVHQIGDAFYDFLRFSF